MKELGVEADAESQFSRNLSDCRTGLPHAVASGLLFETKGEGLLGSCWLVRLCAKKQSKSLVEPLLGTGEGVVCVGEVPVLDFLTASSRVLASSGSAFFYICENI